MKRVALVDYLDSLDSFCVDAANERILCSSQCGMPGNVLGVPDRPQNVVRWFDLAGRLQPDSWSNSGADWLDHRRTYEHSSFRPRDHKRLSVLR